MARRSVAAAVLVFALASALVVGWAVPTVRRLDREIVERFSGRRWEIPSKIYSDSFLVYAGSEEAPPNLEARLERLDYRRVDGEVEHSGEYRYEPRRGRLDVYPRNFDYPGRPFRGFPARIDWADGRAARITRLDTGQPIDSLELEPEILAGIYDRTGKERRVVKIRELPKILVQAVLAAEDRRFFYHHGIDVRGVLRALLTNLRRGRVVQGGSTLTQQLIKNFFLTGQRTLERKVTEAVMAILAEAHYSKMEILETYLNEIYLGQRGSRGIFGVWEGAQYYFGKEPKDLSVGQAAMLAGLIRAPGHLAPAKNPQAAERRRDEVLRNMLETGDITFAEYRSATAEPLPARAAAPENTAAPYFVDYVRNELETEYPLNTLTSEGFRIFTTLDPRLQSDGERAVAEGLAALEKRYPALVRKGTPLQALLLAIQPHTGEIKVMVGGRSYESSPFNRVTDAARQPGSLVQPIVFCAAFEEEETKAEGRFLPTRRIAATPFAWSYEGQPWSPSSDVGGPYAEVTLREAFERSLDSATARLAQEVGLDAIHDVAVRLGLPESLAKNPGLVLGDVDVTAYELAGAFATVANLGFRTEMSAVRDVLDGEGNAIERDTLAASQAISPRVAYLVTNLLQGEVDQGGAQAVREAGIRFPVAGQSGTTSQGGGAWFVGFTPDLLAIVWVGFDHADSFGLSGAQAALPVWVEFMKAAIADRPPTPFLVPPGIQTAWVDPQSGALATARCPTRFDESFFDGEAPTEPCPLHPEPVFPFSAGPPPTAPTATPAPKRRP